MGRHDSNPDRFTGNVDRALERQRAEAERQSRTQRVESSRADR